MADTTAFKPLEEGGFLSPLENVTDTLINKPDTLKLEYPALGRLIDDARQNGKDDSYIRKELARRESMAALRYPQEEINKYLGRTKRTNDELYDAVQREQYTPYINVMRHVLPKERIIDIVNTARYSGFNPSFLLSNHDNKKLIEAAESLAGERRGAFGKLVAAFGNMGANYLQGKANRNRFLAQGIREGDNDDPYMRAIRYFEGDEGVQKERESRAKVLEWWANWEESAAKGLSSHVRPPDSAIGQMFINAIENGGFTIKSSLISALAWAYGGSLGGAVSAIYNTKTESETEAGEVFSEAMRRGLARGLSYEQAARAAYQIAKGVRNDNLALLPATNYGGDFLLHGTIDFFRNTAAELLPGGGFLGKIARGALRVAVPAMLEATPEAVEEYMQEYFQMERLGDPIDERRLREAASAGFLDALIYAPVGVGARAAYNITPWGRANATNARVQSIIDNTVRDIYKLEEQYANGEVKADTIVDQDPIVFLPKSRIDEETAKALGLQGEVMEDEKGNVVPEQPTVEPTVSDETVVTDEGQPTTEVSEETDAETQGSGTEEAEPLEAEEKEVAIRKSVWDSFAAENPEKAQELQDVLREGVQGVTYQEQIARKLDTLRQAFETNTELVEEVKRVEQEALKTGRDESEAKELSIIAGVVANSMNKQYGTDVHTAINLAFRSAIQDERTSDAAREGYNQIIGVIGAAALDAQEGTTIRMDNLKIAEEMTKAGKDAKTIRLATGWERDPDNKWRYEILDAKLDQSVLREAKKRSKYFPFSVKLGELYPNEKLFTAYEQLRHIGVVFSPFMDKGTNGQWLPAENKIELNVVNLNNNSKKLRTTLIHEVQHAIQGIEGFSRGGTPEQFEGKIKYYLIRQNTIHDTIKKIDKKLGLPELKKELINQVVAGEISVEEAENKYEEARQNSKYSDDYDMLLKELEVVEKEIQRKLHGYLDPFAIYLRLGGEVDSRNAETRADFSEAKRRKTLLSETRDVDDWIENYNQTAPSANNAETDTIEQMEAVKEQYEGTDQWLKAPNGNPSNLNVLQWLQVRTANFKRWFGNWEAAAIKERLINGDAVSVQDDGNDLIKGKEDTWHKLITDFANNKKGAPKQLLDFLRRIIPQTITNSHIGDIAFTNNSIRNSLHHGGGKANAIVLPYITEILRNAEFVGTRAIEGDRTSYILAKPLLYKDDRFIMLMVVNEDAQGKKYYDHEFTTIKKIDALPAALRNSKTSENGQRHQSLLSILAEDVWDASASKVVDENGEPLVVERDGQLVFVNDDSEMLLAAGSDSNIRRIYYQSEEDSNNDDEQINARTSWPAGTSAAESQSIVEFLRTANKSSGFHELWHHVFRVLTDAANLEDASDLLKNDVGVILKNAGVTWDDFYNNAGDARRIAHEFFAKSGEAYLREGTAPTPELVSTFERIKEWLVEIYKNIKESLGIELNDEMRDIFDRLLATPEQLAEQKSANEIDTLYEATAEELEYTQAEIERIEAELADFEAREAMANEMRDYVIEPIPQDVIDAVNDWITASEHEGEIEEQYSVDLHSRKKSVREAARERIINMTRNVPLIEVNTNTLNALIAQGGLETAKQYLNERRAYLEKLQKSLEASLPAKNAGIAYQRGEIARLEKRRASLQNKVKRLQKNPRTNAFAIRTMQNEIEDITSRLKDLRDERKGPQNEYDTAKKDISNILNEQREIADSLSALERVENADENTPVDYTESEVSDEDLITLAEALQRGYELAEKYGLAGFEEGRNFQSGIDTEQAEQRLTDLNSEHNREIRDIERQSEKKLDDEILLATMKAKEIHDEDQAKIKSVREQAKVRLKERLAKLRQNQKLMKERQRERNRIRERVKKIRNTIKRMSQSQSIIWNRQQEIKNLLATYDLTKDGKLSLRDYEFIYDQVKELYDTGKRELAAKKLITQERVNKMRQEIMATMQKDWDARPRGAIRHAKDTSKEYNGLRGNISKVIDWTMANAMSAQRFFDYLDGGQKYQGAWSKYFSDEANKAYDKELRYKFARYLDLENFLRSVGLSTKKLSEVRDVKVPHQGSKGWTVDELMSIYAGLKNERSRMAILYGNFSDAETIEQAESWAADCVKALTDQERRVADFIIQEYEKHFDRINEALIDIYNRGMEHEENYTPMRRLDYSTKRDGILDPDAAENLMSSQQGSGFRRVDTGFTKSRQDITEQNQKGIELGLVSMWYSQVETQEHAAAFGQLVRDLRKILMARPKDGETTVRQMVKQTRGLPAWTMIRQYFNLLATSDTMNAYDALDGIAKTLARNMSVAYLCGNLGTVLKQLGSFPRVLPYAGPTAMLNAIAQFMRDPTAFIEECYRLDPQLENRKGDPFITELRRGSGSWYDTLLSAGNYLIGAADRGTSAIVFKAVYDANIRQGLSHDDAVKQAQRVVILTQPVTHVKDKPLLWQQHGLARLAMMFTNDMAQTFGESVYDLTQSIRRGDVKEAVYRLTGLTLAAMMIKLISSGLPDEPDEPEEWGKWITSAFVENELSAVPVIGKGLVPLWDYKRGFFGSQDPFIAPFAKLMAGVHGLWDDKNDNDERAIFNLIEGVALLSPFPATGLKRVWRTGVELGHGELLRAMKRAVGMRVEDRKLKKSVSF